LQPPATTQTLQSIQAQLQAVNPQTQILAVSKFQSQGKIQELYEQGQRKFAENYVQEVLQKMESLQHLDIEWHFIGHLQKNKIKSIIGKFALIHSVDSLELAQVIDRKAQEAFTATAESSMSKVSFNAGGLSTNAKGQSDSQQPSHQQKILLQLNLANEVTKGGFSFEELKAQIPELIKLRHIRIAGLMTMPPLFENPEESRPFFQKLSNIRDQYFSQLPDLKILSMGTSADYLIAASEGASLVRLGTALFGERHPAKK
jgi:uncharacterized pyridoxal phosphate-containing UPF0001 family protein